MPKKHTRRTVIGLCAILIAVGCSEDPTGTDAVQDAEVEMQDNVFQPQTVRVLQGGTVTWVNEGAVQHNTASANVWASENLDPGDTFVRTFPDVGTFNYQCLLHPLVMTGRVIVE